MSAPLADGMPAGAPAPCAGGSPDARAAAYALVAVPLLRLPDEEFLSQLRSEAYATLLDEVSAASPGPAMAEALAAIRAYVGTLPEPDDVDGTRAALDALVLDRTYLVRALAPDVGAPPPYETHWHGPEQGESVMLSLAEAYRKAGLTVATASHQRADYLGIELLFMMRLAQAEADAAIADEATRAALHADQADFFRRHVGSWAVDYAQAALPHAATGFFRGLLQVLLALVGGERAVLAEQAA